MNFQIFTIQKYLKMSVLCYYPLQGWSYTGHTENYDKVKFLEMTT